MLPPIPLVPMCRLRPAAASLLLMLTRTPLLLAAAFLFRLDPAAADRLLRSRPGRSPALHHTRRVARCGRRGALRRVPDGGDAASRASGGQHLLGVVGALGLGARALCLY